MAGTIRVVVKRWGPGRWSATADGCSYYQCYPTPQLAVRAAVAKFRADRPGRQHRARCYAKYLARARAGLLNTAPAKPKAAPVERTVTAPKRDPRHLIGAAYFSLVGAPDPAKALGYLTMALGADAMTDCRNRAQTYSSSFTPSELVEAAAGILSRYTELQLDPVKLPALPAAIWALDRLVVLGDTTQGR